MDLTTQQTENREVIITVKLDEKDLKKYKEQTAKALGKQMKIKGFRPGKAPQNIVEQQVGPAIFLDETLNFALPQLMPEILKEAKAEPVVSPKVKVTEVEPLTLEVTIAQIPEVKLKNIGKLKIKRKKTKPTKEELEGTIYEFQKLHGTYKDVDGPVEAKQRVEIDFEGFDKEGKSLDGTASKNHPIVVGDNTFVPGFEDNLVGMKIDETKEFTVTFPKDYHNADFQNKEVTFKVTVKRIESMELAKIDKALSEKVLKKELTATEFKKEIEKSIEAQKESKETQRQQAELFAELPKHAEVKMSPLIIEAELDYLVHQHKHEIERYGMQWEDYKKMLQEQGKDIREDRREEAKQRAAVRFIMREVVKVENLEPKEAEVLKVLTENGVDKKEQNPQSEAYAQMYDRVLLDNIFAHFLEKPKEAKK